MSGPKNQNTHDNGSRMAASIGAAASIIGCDRSALTAAKRAGAPGFRANGSVDIPEVTEWLKSQPPAPAGQVTKLSLEMRRLTAQCIRLEEDNERAAGRYTPNEEITRDFAKIGAATRAALEQLRGDAPALVGLDAVEIDEWIAKKIEGICAILNDAQSYG